MESICHARWLERLLAEVQIELWIGDAAEIRTRRVRKQKKTARLAAEETHAETGFSASINAIRIAEIPAPVFRLIRRICRKPALGGR